RAPRNGSHQRCYDHRKYRFITHDAFGNSGRARGHQYDHSMAWKKRQLNIPQAFRVSHDIFHQWVGVLNNFIRLITGALSSGIKTNDDRDIIEDLRGHALSKFIVDDEHIDSAFLDGSR